MNFFSGNASVPSISTADKYYFVNEEKSSAVISLYTSEVVTVNDKDIKTMPTSGVVKIIPKEFLTCFNPSKDVLVDIKVQTAGKTHMSSDVKFGDIVKNDYLKWPESLVCVLITAGQHSVDFGDYFVMLSSGMIITKVKDNSIVEKINKCLSDVVCKCSSSSFIVETGTTDLTVFVTMTLNDEATKKFCGERVGRFVVPEIKL